MLSEYIGPGDYYCEKILTIIMYICLVALIFTRYYFALFSYYDPVADMETDDLLFDYIGNLIYNYHDDSMGKLIIYIKSSVIIIVWLGLICLNAVCLIIIFVKRPLSLLRYMFYIKISLILLIFII